MRHMELDLGQIAVSVNISENCDLTRVYTFK